MSNQEAVNIAFHLRNAPALAARAIIEQSHKEWLLNDDCCEEQANYDDMTVVVIYLDHPDPSCEWGYYGECCGGEPCSFAQDGDENRT